MGSPMPASTIKLTKDDVRNCTWTVVEVGDGFRRSIGRGTHPKTGLPIEVMQTEFLEDEKLQDLNADERNVRDTRPWTSGMGSDKGGNVPMVHIARTPLNKYFSELAAHAGDQDHMRWWLNRDANQPFRTRSGKV
jgi:hypothetical protein